jgi:hypothetical protein
LEVHVTSIDWVEDETKQKKKKKNPERNKEQAIPASRWFIA